MVPKSSRQVLGWSLPALAFLLSLLWYRRKRGASLRSDPGGTTQDTASTSRNIVPQAEDKVPTTPSAPAERQLASKEQLCEVVAIDGINLQIDESKSPFPVVKEESKAKTSQHQSPDTELEEKVLPKVAPSVYTSVPGEVDSDISNIDTKKQSIKTREANGAECPDDKVHITQKIPVKSVVKEDAKIASLESSVCNDLESPEYLSDKIIDTDSSTVQSEGKEVDESTIRNLSTSIDMSISPQGPSESCHFTPEVCVFVASDPLERNAHKQNDISEDLEALSMNEVNGEEFSGKLSVLDIGTQETNKDTSASLAELQGSEGEVQVLPLNVDISENLLTGESVEKDIGSVQLKSDIQSSLAVEDEGEVEDDESVSSVDSFSVATTVMARKSSAESSTMEKHAHEDEGAKKSTSEMDLQESESISLECKLSSLELDGNEVEEASSDAVSVSTTGAVAGSYSAASDQQRTERDSANHSPADVMLASPCISSYSDAHSEGSSDSGKGCSDVATPPSRTPASGSSLSGDTPLSSVYEFVLPQHLVGRLIGRHGCFVNQIKTKTNASILIKRHPETQKLKICAVEGTQADIESALEMIRQKFPAKRYTNVTLEQVSFLPPVPTFPLIPECLQLQLVEGVNNDVILSSLVSPAHFFLQQPTHPTFPALNRLNAFMNVCYSEPTAPPIPTPTQAGVICVAPTMGGWYRAQVVAVDAETDTCDIKFVDYGGYLTVNSSVLRQIRSDFMTLPFQAAECYLANVAPIGGEDALWSKESIAGMEELTQGQVLQAQVCGYAEDGLPVVYLCAFHGSQVFVNQELVSRGLAEWTEPAEA